MEKGISFIPSERGDEEPSWVFTEPDTSSEFHRRHGSGENTDEKVVGGS